MSSPLVRTGRFHLAWAASVGRGRLHWYGRLHRYGPPPLVWAAYCTLVEATSIGTAASIGTATSIGMGRLHWSGRLHLYGPPPLVRRCNGVIAGLGYLEVIWAVLEK